MKLLNYFFMNYLYKTAAAATLGEQSGSSFWRLGADTFFIIFISFFELLYYFLRFICANLAQQLHHVSNPNPA